MLNGTRIIFKVVCLHNIVSVSIRFNLPINVFTCNSCEHSEFKICMFR